MILRKPYGFLIKHFRLIHLIITTILVLIAVKFRSIYLFLGKVINDIVNKYDASNYINYGIFLLIILALGLFFIIYWLFKYKDKPKTIYIISLIGYGILAVILFITYNYMSGFSGNVIDQKTIRLYRDIIFICDLFQYLVIVIMFIRGLGFNIKKFDFGKDVQELNLTDEDNEEIEVNVGIDTTNIARKIRKQGREFGYFYQEFKGYIIAIIIGLVLFLIYRGYKQFNMKYKVYKQNDFVGVSNYIGVNNSYYQIEDNKYYVIIKFDTYNNGQKSILNTSNIVLTMGKNKYVPDKNICYKFREYGNCYKQQLVTSEKNNYILVYEVEEVNASKSYIMYNESYENVYKIKLELENITS